MPNATTRSSGIDAPLFCSGRQIATGSWDRTARLWNASTGQSEEELKGHDHWISAVAYSPDGRRLATASWDRTVKLWNTATGERPTRKSCGGSSA